MRCPADFLFTCLFPDAKIFLNGVICAISPQMVEVQHDRAMPDLFAKHSIVDKAFTHLPVSATVLHPFVISVDGKDVILPCRGITIVKGWPGWGDKVKKI